MATVTLTPLHYYQLNSQGIVESIDPTTKKIKYTQNTILLEFSYANAFRYKLISGMTFSLTGRSGSANFSIYRSSRDTAPAVGEKANYTRGNIVFDRKEGTDNFRSLYGFTAGYSTFLVKMDSVYTDTDFSFSSLTMTLTYATDNQLAISMSPTTGYLNPAVANDFTVTAYSSGHPLQNFSLTSGTIKYKLSSASSYTTISKSFSGKPYTITIPANTLTAESTYNIYVTGLADDSSSSGASGTGSFVTNDGDAVGTPVSPKNTVERGDVLFVWSYFNERGTAQHAAEIRYKIGASGDYVYTGKTVTSATSKRITISSAGTIYWSIRTWNSSDVGGAWSDDISFENVVPPSAPTITGITQEGRPTFSWISANQVAYQVQVFEKRDPSIGNLMIYDTGVVYSADQYHKTKKFLPDGSYIFRVRIYNSYGYNSSWNSKVYEQDFSGLPEIPFTASVQPDGVDLTIVPSATYANYYLMRNGVMIAAMDGSSYTDLFPAAENVYTLIAVTSAGMSKFHELTIRYIPPATSIKTEDGTKIDASKRWTSRIKPSKQITPEFELYSFIGADRPEIVVSKMRNTRYSFAFHDANRIAENLIGRDVFYSDIFGNAEWCQVTSVTRSDEWYGNETAVELTAVLHNEEIEI